MTHLTHWPTPDWPHIAYDIHDSEADAHRAAATRTREHGIEVAVVPLAHYDTTTKRGRA